MNPIAKVALVTIGFLVLVASAVLRCAYLERKDKRTKDKLNKKTLE